MNELNVIRASILCNKIAQNFENEHSAKLHEITNHQFNGHLPQRIMAQLCTTEISFALAQIVDEVNTVLVLNSIMTVIDDYATDLMYTDDRKNSEKNLKLIVEIRLAITDYRKNYESRPKVELKTITGSPIVPTIVQSANQGDVVPMSLFDFLMLNVDQININIEEKA